MPRKAVKDPEKAQREKEVMKESKKLMDEILVDDIEISKKVRLPKEIKSYLESLGSSKMVVRYLSDQYRQIQQYRLRSQNQLRSLIQGYDLAGTEHEKILMSNLLFSINQEAVNKQYLEIVTNGIPICRWMKSIVGIGPIFAATLYSYLDIRKAMYATNFLSYAGLNDNNNPWLGKDGARTMVQEVVAERKEAFKEVEADFKSELQSIGVDIKDFAKLVAKGVEQLIEGVEDKLEKKFSKADIIDVEIKQQLIDQYFKTYYKQRWDVNPIVDRVVSKLAGKKVVSYIDNTFADNPYIYEWIICLAYPKFAGNMLINKVAKRTTRQSQNIKNGIVVGIVSTFNSKDETKKVSFNIPTTDNLEAYLAKPPYNLELKKKCYLIGDSFIKQQKRDSLYGHIYAKRLEEEVIRNENREFAAQAAELLKVKTYKKNSEIYKTLSDGRLMKSHLVARARRYAVKLFISHVHEAMYWDAYHKEPPMPYVIEHEGHHDYIPPEVDYKKFL